MTAPQLPHLPSSRPPASRPSRLTQLLLLVAAVLIALFGEPAPSLAAAVIVTALSVSSEDGRQLAIQWLAGWFNRDQS